ncbi:MAG: hypothetical protein EBR81_03710 [Proteobacteria bacterium]|nr:hypothetical protein [Pseudomonadota bacterium]
MCFQKKAEAQPNKDAPSVNRIRKEVATESHQIFKIAIHTCFLVRENRFAYAASKAPLGWPGKIC